MGSTGKRPASMAWSAAAHVVLVAALCLYRPPLPPIPPVPPPFARVTLIAPLELAELPPLPRRKRVALLDLPAAPMPSPKQEEIPRLEEAPRLEAEAAPSIALPAEQPKLEAPLPKPNAVRPAGFEGVPVQAKGPATAARLEVGAFQGLTGAPGGSPDAGRKAEVRQGGFAGASATRADGKPARAVSSGGFAGAVTGSAPKEKVVTASAGFGQARAGKTEARASKAEAAPKLSPVEIVSKPKPVYTLEARAGRIEGDVTLEVRFRADGRAEVLRVVQGLGHGLDEAAVTAVQQMRFRPAANAGEPVDSVLRVSVAFRLAY